MKTNIKHDLGKLLTEGRVMSIDPGTATGWAVIDCHLELVRRHGVIKDIRKPGALVALALAMREADVLVVEDQYLAKDKPGGKKQENPQALISLAAIRGGLQMLWAREKRYGYGENVVLVKPTEWQVGLGVPSSVGRDKLKRAAMTQAQFLIETTGISQDEADAICMGLAITRRLKASHRVVVAK